MPATQLFSGIQIKTSNRVEQDHEELCFFPEDPECLNWKQPKHLVKGIWNCAVRGCLSGGGYISEALFSFPKCIPARSTIKGITRVVMKILILLSCPGNGWGHCSECERDLGRSICLREDPKSKGLGACRTCIFINIARRHFTWLFRQQNLAESTWSD